MSTKRDPNTLDMFNGEWKPKEDVVRTFDPERVRGKKFASLLSNGVSEALTDCGLTRSEVVEKMRQYLGDDLAGGLSENILNAWSSEAREDQFPSAVRLVALIFATQDIRLLNLFAEVAGWVVIERKYLPAIHEAMIADEMEQKAKELQLLEQKRQKARKGWTGAVS